MSFLSGVCEGFYGKPWNFSERKELFERLKALGMNTYIYAPKDDRKHRMKWRELYSSEEIAEIHGLVEASASNDVDFVYAISPGLDMVYSDEEDLMLLYRKMEQVGKVGCNSFAILFDDIELDLCTEDDRKFESLAKAQVYVTNKIYDLLHHPATFLFCPTEYCDSRAVPDVATSPYLETLGCQLHQALKILWTGPRVVSRRISADMIKPVHNVLKRKPVIWDNLHANDYDQIRLFLGPYDGRTPELKDAVSGILTNPSCHYPAIFIPIHTLAQWIQNCNRCFMSDDAESMKEDDLLVAYEPRKALDCSLHDWLPFFYEHKVYSETSNEEELPIAAGTSKQTKKFRESAKDRKSMKQEKALTVGDLRLVCDFFYLPFANGPNALHLLKEAHWLVSNTEDIGDGDTETNQQWFDRALEFHETCNRFLQVINKFMNIQNKDLAHCLRSYLIGMQSSISSMNSFIKWNGIGKPNNEPFRGGEQEPWVNQGGLVAELRRLLPTCGLSDMFPPPLRLLAQAEMFVIRPYFSSDRDSVYSAFIQTCDDGVDGSDFFPEHPELLADRTIGCYLEHFAVSSFVAEDENGIIGYVLVCPDSDSWYNKNIDWMRKMHKKYSKEKGKVELFNEKSQKLPRKFYKKYPACLQLSLVLAKPSAFALARKLVDCAKKMIIEWNKCGCHTLIPEKFTAVTDVHLSLGFAKDELSIDNLGRSYLTMSL